MSAALKGESMPAKLLIFRFGSTLSFNFFQSFCQKRLVKIRAVLGKIRNKILYEASCALLVPKRHLQRGKTGNAEHCRINPSHDTLRASLLSRRGVLGKKGGVCVGFDRLCHHNL